MDLRAFFSEHPKAAIAFSGGVDSAYLLYAAISCGADVRAYYAKSQFQPEFELEDAKHLARELGADMTIIELDVLKLPSVSSNPADRCYHCKKAIFTAISEAAAGDGFHTILDGTNASDDDSDRPGIRAIRELQVLSPLRECGLTKDKIRELSREAGLFTWCKPAYACLATRVPTGEEITAEKLRATENAEAFLHSLGLTDLRVRLYNGAARLQVTECSLPEVLRHREAIITELKKYYTAVLLDLEARK